MSRIKDKSKVETEREFPRISQACPLKFKELSDVPQEVSKPEGGESAVMNNISGGGICFTNGTKIPVGKMLALEMELPGFPTSIISMGKVIWCRDSQEGHGNHDIGVEFWWVGWRDNETQQRVSEYITNSLPE
ncbi:MAG: Tfp pilus assembly protein PilZ [Planctomycetota bacterium]|jgi:Tfp pilus assembly protein PilZ